MPPYAQLFAWTTLASGGMLLWGLAAVIPLVIHLWMRRRYRTVSFAAMEYLLAAMRQHARRWRIEQWTLLAVRTLILLLAAVAWSDPIWSRFPPRSGETSQAQTHHLLVIDVSYSMAGGKGERRRIDEARAAATDIVRAARQGDGFTILLMSQPPRVVIGEPTFDPDVVLSELQATTVVDTGAELIGTLAEAERLIDHVGRVSPRLERHRVTFITDLGRTTWRAVDSPDAQQRLRRLADRAELSLVDVGRGELANLAVTRLDMRDSLVVVGREVTVDAEVQSFASSDLSRRVAEWFVDGQPAGSREIDVPPLGRVALSFSPRFETPGDHTIELRVRDDDVDADNARWLVATARDRIRVLCIEGKPDEARYVALALSPEATVGSRIEAEVASEAALSERDLTMYDVVVLCNVGRFDAGEAAALRRFVAAGGGLAVFAGDLVQPESYHQWLGPRQDEPAVLPVQLGRLLSDAGNGLDPLNYRHPIVAPFRGQPQAGLLTTPVWRMWELTPYDRTRARVALALASGAPLIVDGPAGRGRCLVVGTSASAETVDRTADPPTPWTALAAWPSFVPLVQESLHLLVQTSTTSRNVDVGHTLAGASSSLDAAATLEIAGPLSSRRAEADAQRVTASRQGDESTWSWQPPLRAGLYQWRAVGGTIPSQWFAVNMTTDESDLTRFDPELLPTALHGHETLESTEATAAVRISGHPWFRYLLVGVGILLVSESLLAWRLGTRGAVQAK